MISIRIAFAVLVLLPFHFVSADGEIRYGIRTREQMDKYKSDGRPIRFKEKRHRILEEPDAMQYECHSAAFSEGKGHSKGKGHLDGKEGQGQSKGKGRYEGKGNLYYVGNNDYDYDYDYEYSGKGKGYSKGKGYNRHRVRRGLHGKGHGLPPCPEDIASPLGLEFEDWEIAEPQIYTGEDPPIEKEEAPSPEIPKEDPDSPEEEDPIEPPVLELEDNDPPEDDEEQEKSPSNEEPSPSNESMNQEGEDENEDVEHLSISNEEVARQGSNPSGGIPGLPALDEFEVSPSNEDYKSMSNDEDYEE